MGTGTKQLHRAYLVGWSIKLLRQMGADDAARQVAISALQEGMPNALVGVAWEEGGRDPTQVSGRVVAERPGG